MRDSGVSIMGTGIASGDNRAMQAIDQAINSPLLEDNDIRGAQHILLNISSGNDEVTMDEIGAITDFIQDEAGHGTDLIWGNCYDERLGDKISLTIIATGFKKEIPKQEIKPTIKVPLNETFDLNNENITPNINANSRRENTIDLEINNVSSSKNEGITDSYFSKSEEPFVKASPVVDTSKDESTKKKEDARKEYLRNLISKPLESPKVIAEMESEPAYLRRKVELDDIGSSNRNPLSRMSVSMEDDDQPIIERGNSFLHDNVD